MNYIILILYALFAVSGANLMKYGGTVANVFVIPVIDIKISLLSILGLFCYGVSFLLYFVLLNKFDLSFLIAITLPLVYGLLFLSSIFVFHEAFTISKLLGFVLMIFGGILIVKK